MPVQQQSDRVRKSKGPQRARALLLRLLSSEQRENFEQYGYFYVTAGGPLSFRDHWRRREPRRRYLICSYDVFEMAQSGHYVASFCVHPLQSMPTWDWMLQLKLLIETDERKFLSVANRR